MPQNNTKSVKRNESDSAAFVEIEKGFTKNMGDFNSAKVSVRVRLPLNPTREDFASVKATIRKVETIVESEITTQLAQLTSVL